MRKFLKSLLSQTPLPEIENKDITVKEISVAVIVLLLEAAWVDGECTEEEQDNILRTLKKRFNLTSEESEALIKIAHQERDNSLDLWTFTNRINQTLSKDDKRQMLLAVWRILYADGKLDAHEDYFVHKLARLLNLRHPDLIEAKLIALKEMQKR